MISLKKRLSLLSAILALLLLAGCWDRYELNYMALVTGMGIDRAENGMISLTLQVNKSTEESGSGGKGDGGDKSQGSGGGSFYITQKTAHGIHQSIREFFNSTSRQIILEHNQVIVFGKDQAEHGLLEWFDFFTRDNESRMDVLVFIAEGTAKDVLSLAPPLEKLPSEHLVRLDESQSVTSDGYSTDLLRLMQNLLSKSQASPIGFIKIIDDNGTPTMSLAGLAVLKKGRLVGTMDEKATSGFRLITNDVTDGLIPLYTPHGQAFLQIKHSKTKLSISMKDDIPHVKVKIHQRSALSELQGHTSLSMDELYNTLVEYGKNALKDYVATSFLRAQELNADIFGIANQLNISHPKEWKKIEHRWDELFPQVTMEVEVDLIIETVGRIVRMDKESVVLMLV